MKVRLAYGRRGLVAEVPDDRTTVIEPTYLPGLERPEEAIRNALRRPIESAPLKDLIGGARSIAISVCDVTRPMPSAAVLPVLLAELISVPRNRIVILVATGTHRPNTPDELSEMLGPEVVRDYEVINHSAFEEKTLAAAGATQDGIPIWLNRRWLESDFRITAGFIEPHFFAGFSGGPKMVAPGLAGIETILRLHGADLLSDPNSTWGVLDENPIHRNIREIGRRTGIHFGLDVAINREHEITAVFAGELFASHRLGTEFVRRTAMRPVPELFPVVVTTNSGYPLDLNLYQSVKGMSAAARVVDQGGTIICAAECSDGIPDHGEFARLLGAAGSPEGLLELIHSPGFSCHDQWQVQVQAQILLRARVWLKSGFLSEAQVRAAHLEPVAEIEEAVLRALGDHGPGARLCVLPEGPQTIPYLAG